MLTKIEKNCVDKINEVAKFCMLHDIEFECAIYSGKKQACQADLSYINVYEMDESRHYIDEKNFLRRYDKFMVNKKLEYFREKNPECCAENNGDKDVQIME